MTPNDVRVTMPSLLLAQIETSAHELNHRPRRGLEGSTPCAVFHDDAQRLRWTLRQQIIFRLLFRDFERMIGTTPQHDHRRLATLSRVTVEAWLRPQDLICVRQNQIPTVSTNYPEKWPHN